MDLPEPVWWLIAALAGYALGYWVFGSDLGIGLDLFGVSIGLWIISEVLYRFWSRPMRPLSGFVGFAVALAFGITPSVMLGNPGEYWWVVLFWLPGLFASHPAPGRRRYTPWFWVGVGSFMTAYAIWLTGTNEHSWCRPDSLIQAHAIWQVDSEKVKIIDDPNNGITIDGKVELSDRTNQIARFKAAGWSVLECDGHDPEEIDEAVKLSPNYRAPGA